MIIYIDVIKKIIPVTFLHSSKNKSKSIKAIFKKAAEERQEEKS